MKNGFFRSLLIAALFSCSGIASALPMLSADGAQLSGLDVDGVLYDVTFGDGIVEEVFPIEEVTAPGWYDLSRSVSRAIFDALAGLSSIENDLIAGCEDNPGIPNFVGEDVCIIVTPDRVKLPDTWRAENLVVVFDGDVSFPPPPYNAGIFGYADTTAFGYMTLASFREANEPVPGPGTPALILVGVFLMLRVTWRR